MLVSFQTSVKGGHGHGDSEITLRMENWRGEDWDETQNGAYRVRSIHSPEIKLVFGCFYVSDIAKTGIHTWKECKNNKE